MAYIIENGDDLKVSVVNFEDLNKSLGVDFLHYWFYKLEFVLWSLHKDKDERWRKFRMTAKNSVEHISPQHPKETDKNRVSASVLNTFGNLALVSRSINSEYSNLPYNEKRQRFKNNNSYKLDSLKMDLIYEKDMWNDDLASQHQKYMIDCLKKYLNINE
ncbi:HNH endonuclease family protein [Saccharicrinis sp. 156]|uniref:HNH endonuclease family protein n=1 Tax=Saccharicrinis sp. 156 TaxID=3417574 RepID=UPI003D347360